MEEVKLLAPTLRCTKCGSAYSKDDCFSEELCNECVVDAYEESMFSLAEGF